MLTSEVRQLFPGLWLTEVEDEVNASLLEDTARFRSLIALTVQSTLGFHDHSVHEETFVKHRSPENPRPVFSGDHFWHHDLMREGDKLQRVMTCLRFVEADGDTPGTQFIDTVALHEYLVNSGFYANLGYTEHDLRSMYGLYSERYYRDKTLAEYYALTNYAHSEQIEALRNTLANGSPRDPISRMPLLTEHPDGKSVVFDHERCMGIYDQNGERQDRLLAYLRLATSSAAMPDLALKNIVHTVQPEEGTMLIFERPRAMHRSLPGNDSKRIIQLGWASVS